MQMQAFIHATPFFLSFSSFYKLHTEECRLCKRLPLVHCCYCYLSTMSENRGSDRERRMMRINRGLVRISTSLDVLFTIKLVNQMEHTCTLYSTI